MKPHAFQYIPSAGPFIPTAALVPKHPRLAYNIYFQQNASTAIEELNRDIRRTLRATLRDVATPPPEKFLTSTQSFLYGYEEYKTVSYKHLPRFMKRMVDALML